MFIVLYLFIPHPEDGIYNMLDIRIFIGLVLFLYLPYIGYLVYILISIFTYHIF